MPGRPLFFVDQVNERWLYTLDFIFKKRGLKYYITEDIHSFESSNEPKINFGSVPKENSLNWKHCRLLDQEEIFNGMITHLDFKGIDCFAFDERHDPLSSIFFVLTRMEEYLIKDRDNHGRFSPKSSYQYKYDWLEECICDKWADWLLAEWGAIVGLTFKQDVPIVNLIPTFDIDNAFAYKLKDGTRRMLSIFRDLSRFDRFRLTERKKVLNEEEKDPYDTYDLIMSVADNYDVRVFWLVGEYSNYDRNISIKHKQHQKLIQDISVKIDLGIHPSYRSDNIPYHILKEKETLEKVIGKQEKVKYARQHFLRLSIPETYLSYLKCGIKEDFTMGYADNIGFRAGTAKPFFWFDLEKNSVTNLLIRPFAYMDGSLLEYMEFSIQEAQQKIDKLYAEVEKYGGDFIFIWHNETIGNYGKWKGWNNVLTHTLDLQKH
jgi:hypothetical protein